MAISTAPAALPAIMDLNGEGLACFEGEAVGDAGIWAPTFGTVAVAMVGEDGVGAGVIECLALLLWTCS